MNVRVRFAPSPTGKLHVGSARTALFNWLFAKHHGGVFVLRIEDTDQKRSKSEFLDDIYASLKFLGIHADEGPYFQSQRLCLYQEQIQRLLQSGKAIQQDGAVVFQVQPQQVTFTDLLRGPIQVDTALFETLVLMKSDGSPTYNFACVVDDAAMNISHVIRGDDHIANTPKQVILYQALGFSLPVFAHIPLIVGADRARLSKRFGATSVDEYRQVGYLPEAFVNYLALLGWAPGGNRELVQPEEIVQLFDLAKVRKAAAQFDQRKLDWLNSQYLKQTPIARLADLLAERAKAKGWLKEDYDREWMQRLAALLQDRLRVLEDVEEQHAFFFLDAPEYQKEAVDEFLHQDGVAQRLLSLRERLAQLKTFEASSIEEITRAFIAEQKLTPKQLIHPVRVAITGRAVSPPLFETMSLLGQQKVLRRLENAATM
ncbi:MAG: glutamate--tRNA ligase [Candidatus Omnitrophica bacterium]|nr:glutamate--tRNA ligase [Candidatus Omnitrophota bacterium]MBI2174846.1 glutamate--tRNA ligase [Candidatus Omnitrophota bacterium]MBI3010197.1 glutamate--tRNA ligase [Candidatus Omnitrophota bacterium]